MPEMDEEAASRLRAYNERQSDFKGYCPICKKDITGTPQDLRDHNFSHTGEGE